MEIWLRTVCDMRGITIVCDDSQQKRDNSDHPQRCWYLWRKTILGMCVYIPQPLAYLKLHSSAWPNSQLVRVTVH